MAEQQPGVLAIWNDCRAGREGEFEAWFQGEHLQERLAVPGFLFGRRHQAISGSAGYFNFYLVESPDVLTSKPYLERLDNPTPMTKRIMSDPRLWAKAHRTLGMLLVSAGVLTIIASFAMPRWALLVAVLSLLVSLAVPGLSKVESAASHA